MRRSLALLLLLAPRAFGQPAPLPRGEPIPRVECAGSPGKSYALYLPKAYTTARRWPVLYLLDPDRRGMLPIPALVPSAERFGWILASSNDSKGDGPIEAMTQPFLAMLADTHARLAVDDARVAIGGFSAGARVSAFMGQVLKSAPAAVLGCGAGFFEERPPTRDVRFAWFGTVGLRDFNYVEMKRLALELGKLGVRHRLALFDGPHAWPPPEMFTEAIAWMEAWSRAGSGTASPELLAELEAGARDLEKTDPLPALEVWEAIARDLKPLGDVGEAERRAKELRAARKKEIREDEKRDERDARTMGRLEAVIQDVLKNDPPPPPAKLLTDLGVSELLARAEKDASREERLSAVRLLAALHVRLRFYLPRDMKEKGDVARGALFRSAGETIAEGLRKAGY